MPNSGAATWQRACGVTFPPEPVYIVDGDQRAFDTGGSGPARHTEGTMRADFAGRALRAARLDAKLFEEVENDPRATAQAASVVVLAAIAAGVGSGARGVGELLLGTVAALVSWVVWAYLAYWIGTRLFPEPATRSSHGELLRTVGFASAPGVLRVLGVIGPLRGLVFLVAALWMLVATVIAVRQALDYRSTWRAAGVSAVGWAVQLGLLATVVWLLGSPARP